VYCLVKCSVRTQHEFFACNADDKYIGYVLRNTVQLFVFCDLFKYAISSSGYVASDDWMINEQWIRQNDLGHYPGIYMGRLRKTVNRLRQDNQSPGQIFIQK
jgi:hypothetical protein